MPSRPVQALLAVEPGVDAEGVKDSLPGGEDFTVVGVVNGAEEALSVAAHGGVADLLLVACAGYSDRALLLLDSVARQSPDLNVMVLGHGSPNGFLRRAFEAGADDIVMLRRRRSRSASRSTSSWPASRARTRRRSNENSRLVCILGPKGGTGKTLTSTNLAVCLAQRGERVALDRPRPPVRRRGAVPRAAAGENACTTSRSPRARSTGTSCRRSWHCTPRGVHAHRSAAARPGERGRRRAPARDLLDPAPELRLGHRRHAAGLHAPRSSRRSTTRPTSSWSGCSTPCR